MNKNQLLALAAFITSLANGDGESVQQPTPDPDVPATPKKPRGRPPGTATPPPVSTAPAEPAPVAPAEPEKPAEEKPAPTGGKSIEELRELFKPLVKGQWMPGWKEGDPVQPRGKEVQAVINKYAPTLIQMDAKDYPAFEKDIEALLY